MTHTWEQLEGVSLAGEYGLEQWLGSDPTGAFFLTSFGPERQRAVLKLTEENPSTAAAQLTLWQRTSWLDHPSLMALLDCGRTDSGDDSFLYAVFEEPDDSLTAAVRYGPMDEQEACDVLAAVVDALQYLHARGWAHTSIDAEHVVAVGDRIKLASDTLRDANEEHAAQSDDVWALGALVYELATGRRIRPGETAGFSGISDPLRTMLRHAVEPDVDRRWTASQLAEALDARRPGDLQASREALPPAHLDSFSAPVASAEPLIVAEPWRTDVDQRSPELTAADDPWIPAERCSADEDSLAAAPQYEYEEPPADPPNAAHRSPVSEEFAAPVTELPESAPRPPAIMVHEPFSIFGSDGLVSEEPAVEPPPPEEPTILRYVPLVAVAAVALLAIVFVIAQHATSAPPAVAILPPPVAEPAARVIPASAPKPAVPNWRVIAFTYSRYKDAEKKAQSINTKYAGIHAEVYTLGSNPSSYLVSLGAHLTREEATALRRKALGKGLPRDTFIRNFSE